VRQIFRLEHADFSHSRKVCLTNTSLASLVIVGTFGEISLIEVAFGHQLIANDLSHVTIVDPRELQHFFGRLQPAIILLHQHVALRHLFQCEKLILNRLFLNSVGTISHFRKQQQRKSVIGYLD